MAWEKLRVGVVGAGDNTRKFHIPRLQAIDGVEVVSVANRSRASGERVAQQFGIPTVYDSWPELVAAPDTDAIVIGTWPYLHCPVTLAALAAGKHVLTEARMAMNAAEAHAMLAAARAQPTLTTMVVPSPFSLGVDAAIQERIAEGYLGEIVSVELHGNAPSFAEIGGPLHWRQNRDLSGVNMMTMGIWYEAALRWVGEATRVLARTKVVVRSRLDQDAGEARFVTVPDHVEVIADMACGAIGHFSFSAATGLARPPEVWLFGTEGTLHWQMGSQTLAGGRRGSKELTPIDVRPEQRGGWRVEEEFVNAVRGLEPVRRTSFEDGVRYMEFTEAVARSAASGNAVSLPLLDRC
jgi:predicted dehydrogenase